MVGDSAWDQPSETRLQSKKGVKIARAPFFYRVGTQKYLHQLSEARGKSVGGSHP